MSGPRYALYFAPEEGSALARFGWDWLGRHPAHGEALPLPDLGLPQGRHAQVVADARRYGFHATLKPPFRLAEGTDAAQLRAALADFAKDYTAFAEPPLALADLHGFLALRPSQPAPRIHALADECVRRFDRFRAPAAPDERARRLAAGLTPRQVRWVEQWGYPYVFDDYRFHMTLTCRLDTAEREVWRQKIVARLGLVVAEPVVFRAVSLFMQPEADQPFVLMERASFGR